MVSVPTSAIPPTYASYTYEHPSWVVRYPHLKRLQLLADSLQEAPFTSWLDYGSGDGSLFHRMHLQGSLDGVDTVLYEPDLAMREQIFTPNGAQASIISTLDSIGRQTFDVITALEVLEHLPLPERIKFYQVVARHLNPDGRCIIEVPIEIGPVLLLKEYARRFLKDRSVQYRGQELLAAAFLGRVEDIHRRFDIQDSRTFISPHRGFDACRCLDELQRIGAILQIKRSPFPFFPAVLNQCLIVEFRLRLSDPKLIKETVIAGMNRVLGRRE